jgi:FkbM family methyltransferase
VNSAVGSESKASSAEEARRRLREALTNDSEAAAVPDTLRDSFPRAAGALGRWRKSQFDEDLALYEQFFSSEDSNPGFFVEMGALDGVLHSNTYALEKAGWRGVLLEANPRSCARLFANRPLAVTLCTAVATSLGFVEFETGSYDAVFAQKSAMSPQYRAQWHPSPDAYQPKVRGFRSNSQRTVRVPTAPLGQLLRAVGVAKIDLFSLDVEGAEADILEAFDWTIPVHVWCIEAADEVSASGRNRVAELMMRHGYRRVAWAHVHGDERSKIRRELNQLWVHPNWQPKNYAWHQLGDEGGSFNGIDVSAITPGNFPPSLTVDRPGRSRRRKRVTRAELEARHPTTPATAAFN